MSIERFIKTVCVQTAVYWGSPVNDGYGKFSFADPVEIPVRWEDKTEVLMSAFGMEQITDANILVTTDKDLHGYVWLGNLSALTEEQKADPMLISGSREIIAFEKIPMIKKTNDFVRKIYVKRKNTA